MQTSSNFSSTCPSLPILTGLPSFQGLYRCCTFWKLRSPLQIQSRWKTPPRALADKPGGSSQETWKVKSEAMNCPDTLKSIIQKFSIPKFKAVLTIQGNWWKGQPLPWVHPSCFLWRAERHHRTFQIPDNKSRCWLKTVFFCPFYTFTE